MFCKNCGKPVEENAAVCGHCGTPVKQASAPRKEEKESVVGWRILGFCIPLIGLIVYCTEKDKHPERAKAAGKGALTGFVTGIIAWILLAILWWYTAMSTVKKAMGKSDELLMDAVADVSDTISGGSTDDILANYLDVTFGEFQVTEDTYFTETSLEVTVKNKADEPYTYYISVEAIDETGARLGTDTLSVSKLGAGQEMRLTAFEYVDRDKVDQFKTAKFRVFDVSRYAF